MTQKKDILTIFPEEMRSFWSHALEHGDCLQEIRIRAGKPVLFYADGQEWCVDAYGQPGVWPEDGYCMDQGEIDHILAYACSDSMYAFEEELSRGYLTLPGGHRMGVCGEIIPDQYRGIRNMKHISCINIRIAHEVRGAADGVLPYLYDQGSFLNTLLISPPCCGKTTLLRDIVRQVSDGNSYADGMTVGVVDERSEIAGAFQGQAQNDVGMRTDVLDGCPKELGMILLIRSMAPGVVAVDELGGGQDMEALGKVLTCGCRILATIHADSAEAAAERIGYALPHEGVFERFITLGRREGQCCVLRIQDGTFSILYER